MARAPVAKRPTKRPPTAHAAGAPATVNLNIRTAGPRGPALLGAVLVNITALQAERAMPMQAHACSAKAGIEMLTRCLALEWGVEGIRVYAISPGPIAETGGLARLATDAGLAERIRGALALPRFGQRIDIGNAVAWLCSEAASFVTGTTINCDGGMRLGNLYAPE